MRDATICAVPPRRFDYEVRMIKGLYVLSQRWYAKTYGPSERSEIERSVDIYASLQTTADLKKNPSILQEAEVLFSGWDGPLMDAEFLDAARNLKMVFYGAGTIRRTVSEPFWNRGIRITSVYVANAIPVAE